MQVLLSNSLRLVMSHESSDPGEPDSADPARASESLELALQRERSYYVSSPGQVHVRVTFD